MGYQKEILSELSLLKKDIEQIREQIRKDVLNHECKCDSSEERNHWCDIGAVLDDLGADIREVISSEVLLIIALKAIGWLDSMYNITEQPLKKAFLEYRQTSKIENGIEYSTNSLWFNLDSLNGLTAELTTLIISSVDVII